MRDFFEIFNENCSKMMNPPEYLSIDETLYPSRGRISFKNYNPSKPARYGLLFQSLNSVEWAYTHSIIVSAGKPQNGTGEYYINNVPDKVKALVRNTQRSVKLTGRNISTDRYYTSIPVADWLLSQKITTLGTLQKNRVGLPKEVVSLSNRETYSYELYWDFPAGILNLHSYAVVNKSKGSKNVLLLSTMDHILGTTKQDKGKRPAAIELYNFTKGGTDIFDQRYTQFYYNSKQIKFHIVCSFFINQSILMFQDGSILNQTKV